MVLNLSHPDQWIETFGMTALEAMYYKLPVIVPTVGGIAEIVENGYNGFHLDYRSLNEMQEKIEELVINKSLYNTLSENAFKYAQKFNESEYRENLNGLVREFIQNSDPVQKSILLR
ncbi:MAG: glycosyltransferase family 4 protein [Chitinophagaceae bacterium]|nr:glycosyltransferase family 4 protein [Chitinophagaceae bacterium]